MYTQKMDLTNRYRLLKGDKVALYGAGKYGVIALENIKRYMPNLKVVCFIDDDRTRNNCCVEGVNVCSLEDIKEIKDCNIIITNYYVSEVLKKIQSKQYDIDKVFFWPELLIEDVDYRYNEDNKEKIQEVICLLEDYLSKKILKTLIEARYDKRLDLLALTCEKEQYFPLDIFKLSEEEVFVDAGAFDGDTIETFLKQTKYKYKNIYAFEPDGKNYSELNKRNYGEKIKIFNAGLYNENKEIKFAANKGGSSKITENGSDTIKVLKFDDLQLEEISFIKMDIEGSELKALQGMKETIKKYKPKLAICIYHKFEDLWEIPLYIKNLVPEYKIYIRNYLSYLDEIVLYAVI